MLREWGRASLSEGGCCFAISLLIRYKFSLHNGNLFSVTVFLFSREGRKKSAEKNKESRQSIVYIFGDTQNDHM